MKVKNVRYKNTKTKLQIMKKKTCIKNKSLKP